MDLSTESTTVDGRTVVVVKGEVDAYSAPMLRDRLDAQIIEGHHDLIVDLSGVSFMDSTGLGVLVGRLKHVRQHEGSILIAAPGERVRKVFAITGLDRVFAIHETVDDALAPQ